MTDTAEVAKATMAAKAAMLITNQLEWSLYTQISDTEKPILLNPLQWRGGNQVSDLNKMIEFFRKNNGSDKTNILLYKSICGSGKSATLLHLIENIGKGIIVTPFKNLQRQYMEDYYKGDKFVLKKDGTRLKVAVMLGRNNFQCRWIAEQYNLQQKIIEENEKLADEQMYVDDNILNIYNHDSSCANKMLPCNKALKMLGKGKRESRIGTACKCPFWLPTPMPKSVIDRWQDAEEEDLENLEDLENYNENDGIVDIKLASTKPSDLKSDLRPTSTKPSDLKSDLKSTKLDKIKEKIKCTSIEWYESVGMGTVGVFVRGEKDETGKECPQVCPYYQQFYAYTRADVIVMNSAKWYIETQMGRKPLTNVEIMDEGDAWLDYISETVEVSRIAMDRMYPIDNRTAKTKKDMLTIFDMYFKKVKDSVEKENKIKGNDGAIIGAYPYKGLFQSVKNYLSEYKKHAENDENIEQKILDIELILRYIDKASLSYNEGKREETKVINVFIPYPDNILKELFASSSENIVITSGTIHSKPVLNSLFGINADNYNVEMLEGRKDYPGRLICINAKDKTVKVSHTTWQSPQFKEYYGRTLNYILDNLKIVIDKATSKPGDGKIIVLTPAKKYADSIINRPDVFVDFAKNREDGDSIKAMINTSISDYVDKTLEDIRKIKSTDIELDGDVHRTDKQIIASTRMVRGADLRDDKCRGVVLLKWPIPDISDGYLQALKKRFGDKIFWDIIHDKAERESIQMVSRGLRHDMDWEYFSSPDDVAFNNVYRLFIRKY